MLRPLIGGQSLSGRNDNPERTPEDVLDDLDASIAIREQPAQPMPV
jgi:hypothetical protein